MMVGVFGARAQTPQTPDAKTNENPEIVDTLIAGAEFSAPGNRAIRRAMQWAAIVYDNNQYSLLHRTDKTPDDAIYLLHGSQGRPTHLAAAGRTVYLLFDSRSVFSITYDLERAEEATSPLPILSDRVLPALPGKGRVLGWSATNSGPIALLANDTLEAAPEAPPLEVYRLVKSRWEMIPAPEGLVPNHIRALAPISVRHNRFGVISGAYAGDDTTLHVLENGQWTAEACPLPEGAETQVISIQDIAYAVQREASARGALHIYRLRNGQAQPVGEFHHAAGIQRFWATPAPHSAAAFIVDDEKKLAWARVDVLGSGAEHATTFQTLTQQPMPMPEVDPGAVLVLVAVTIGMAFLFFTTRSDPAENTPDLPVGSTLADRNRAFAGLLDLLGPMLLCTWWFELDSPLQIIEHWPFREKELADSLPALVAIGLMVAHTTISEMLTASTIGKWVFRCRVTDLKGQPPHVWQVLTRNAFKILELAAPYLLLLPLISPFHQRLGDLIAKTVVVNKPPGGLPTHEPAPEDRDPDSDNNS
jgi:uncharacterized RDD family membrane protein YckC